jgi:hypothetical protein
MWPTWCRWWRSISDCREEYEALIAILEADEKKG